MIKTLSHKWFIPGVFILLWSGGAIFVELGLAYAEPLPFLTLRFLIATVLMWGFCLVEHPSSPTGLSEWGIVVLTAVFQQIGYQFFYFLALDHDISPGVLTIILGAQPVLTAVLMREGTSRFQWLGLAFGMIGLICVVGRQMFSGSLSLSGILYSLLSLLSITIGTMTQKSVRVSLLANVTIQYTCSFIIFTVLSLSFGSLTVQWTGLFLLSLLYMALGVTAGATMLFYHLISKGNLTNTTSIFYCVPPVTAIMDYFVFGHVLYLTTLIGMILIVAGMALINKRDKVHAERTEKV
ncbi:DMT family transporter [Sporolactobacillus sp. THM7-7]|nr:DMT family transporter [Sporolactobacillus sp. THM7-7]